MSDYDDFDEFWCREYLPLTEQLDKLRDGNRYHEMLLTRISAAASARWLVKPANGFVSPEHQAFFMTSFRTNLNRGLGVIAASGNSGFINGKVYAQMDTDPELESIPDAFQPIAGMVLGSDDQSRIAFENWWKDGKAVRSAWRVQGIVAKMAAGDRMYAYLLQQAGGNAGKVDLSRITAKYPGWSPDDGSAPVL